MHTNPFLLISELPAFFWQSRQFLILPVKVLTEIFPIKKPKSGSQIILFF